MAQVTSTETRATRTEYLGRHESTFTNSTLWYLLPSGACYPAEYCGGFEKVCETITNSSEHIFIIIVFIDYGIHVVSRSTSLCTVSAKPAGE